MPKLISPLTHDLQLRLISALSANIAARGIKQKWVAAKAGLDPTYLGALLRGDKVASLNTMILIGQALDLELKADWKKK